MMIDPPTSHRIFSLNIHLHTYREQAAQSRFRVIKPGNKFAPFAPQLLLPSR